jgi:hypothetical protein
MCAFSVSLKGLILCRDPSTIIVSPFATRQLRDLIICPDERGLVNYVQDRCIMERDITDPSSVSTLISLYPFVFVSFCLFFFHPSMRGTSKRKITVPLGVKEKSRLSLLPNSQLV